MQKVVVISGASRGIGRACALKFAEEGYALSLCAIERMDLLEELKSELEKSGARVMVRKCDVSSSYDVNRWIEDTTREFGRIDVLVSNAGIALYSLLINTPESDWDRIMNVNLKGGFLTSKAVYDTMVSQKSGSIVFVSSIWGKIGGAMEAAYSCSKAGLIALTKSLAKELGPSNIRVNAVAPGGVNTDMLSCFSKTELGAYSDMIPLGRIAEPEEVASAVYFLASQDSSYSTGSVLSMDGGLT